MLTADLAQDFYPPYVGAFASYVPLESDASPQAGAVPVSLSRTGTSGGAGVSTAIWAAGIVIVALILIHVLDEVD